MITKTLFNTEVETTCKMYFLRINNVITDTCTSRLTKLFFISALNILQQAALIISFINPQLNLIIGSSLTHRERKTLRIFAFNNNLFKGERDRSRG